MNSVSVNPFADDAERHAIWEMLMRRDFVAFVSQDWSMVDPDFLPDEFYAVDGRKQPNPDDWQLRFPDLSSYRTEWLVQAMDFQKIELQGISKLDFLYQSAELRRIDINGRRALAQKKFDGSATTTTGAAIRLSWQTLYSLRKPAAQWKITAFVGYLPNSTS
jgi:hypothetical protein